MRPSHPAHLFQVGVQTLQSIYKEPTFSAQASSLKEQLMPVTAAKTIPGAVIYMLLPAAAPCHFF